MLEYGVEFLEDLEYKWVDGYKHRQILTEIGWGYNTKDGYYALEQAPIDEANKLEECLGYINNGVSELMDCVVDGFDDFQKAVSYNNPVYEHALLAVEKILESYKVYTMEDVNKYLTIVEDLKRGETKHILGFGGHMVEQVKLFYDGKFEI